MMPYIIITVIVIVLIAIWAIRKSRYYGKVFCESHFTEVAAWAAQVLDKHPVEESSIDDETALMTGAGVAIAYTSGNEEGNRTIHFSISQAGGYTTGAVGGRFTFLLMRLLNKNKCEANLFKTQSTVHHAVFTMPASNEWITENIEQVVSDMNKYQPLPISTVDLAEQGGELDAASQRRLP